MNKCKGPREENPAKLAKLGCMETLETDWSPYNPTLSHQMSSLPRAFVAICSHDLPSSQYALPGRALFMHTFQARHRRQATGATPSGRKRGAAAKGFYVAVFMPAIERHCAFNKFLRCPLLGPGLSVYSAFCCESRSKRL